RDARTCDEPVALVDRIGDDRDHRVTRRRGVAPERQRVAERVDLTAAAHDPVAAPTRGGGHADDVGNAETEPGKASEEARIAEVEDAAVARDHRVALAAPMADDADDGLIQSNSASRSIELGVTEAEDATIARDE